MFIKIDYFVGCTGSKTTLGIQPGMGQGHHRPYGIQFTTTTPKKMKLVYFKIHYTKLHILGRFNSRCQLNRKA